MTFFTDQERLHQELAEVRAARRREEEEARDQMEWTKLARLLVALFPQFGGREDIEKVDSFVLAKHRPEQRAYLFLEDHVAFYNSGEGLRAVLLCRCCQQALTYGSSDGMPVTNPLEYYFGYAEANSQDKETGVFNRAATVGHMAMDYDKARGMCNLCRAEDDERQRGPGVFAIPIFHTMPAYLLVRGESRAAAARLYLAIREQWANGDTDVALLSSKACHDLPTIPQATTFELPDLLYADHLLRVPDDDPSIRFEQVILSVADVTHPDDLPFD